MYLLRVAVWIWADPLCELGIVDRHRYAPRSRCLNGFLAFLSRVVKKLMHGFSWTVDPVCLRSRQDSTASSLIRRVLQAGKESIRVAPLPLEFRAEPREHL